MTAPHSSLEIERKYDADADTPLPDWSALPGVASVGEVEVRELDARYLDTEDAALARAGVALRRRTGGPDAGWHVKITVPEGKQELHWPLGDLPADEVPAPVVAAVERWARPPFAPIARIRNQRHAYALTDADGRLVAEFVDDRVEAEAAHSGRVTAWREWELELGPAAPADEIAEYFAAADALVFAAGGRIAASGSKLARALTS
ncbi:adenylate cyclase [Microbacterium mangrovi]|uniref:Adenylate cyclase n=1 Tax=Microbacterium mangrovi TaxID=1348253 RepID=A0A0B2AC21_9MICO|nr:CYTH domain-containing protein [Microbacterium mangrovi]KHK99181.1 adenylate cyclase [Microbacterium mangrovi]